MKKVEVLKTFGLQKKGSKIEVSENVFKMLEKKGFLREIKTRKNESKKD